MLPGRGPTKIPHARGPKLSRPPHPTRRSVLAGAGALLATPLYPGRAPGLGRHHLLGITHSGELRVSVDDSDGGAPRWLETERRVEGIDWGRFDAVFAGGDGVVYGREGDHLFFHRLLDPEREGDWGWSADSGTSLGGGWGPFAVAGGPHFILDFSQGG